MIKISSSEAEYLRSKRMGKDVHMSSSTHKSRAKRYWMTESNKSMAILADYRRKQTVRSEG